MKKNIVVTTLLAMVLCMGLVACASNATAADTPAEEPVAEVAVDETAVESADVEAVNTESPASQVVSENPPAANGFGGPIPEFDQGCLTCHESYQAVAELTAELGDSNPHNSVHGSYETCENCHAADKVINEDHKCLSCHDWPRQENGQL